MGELHSKVMSVVLGSVCDDECEICRAELTRSKMAEQNIKYEQVMDEIENSIEAHQRSLSTIDMDNMRLTHQINMLTSSPAPRSYTPRHKPESRSNRNRLDQDRGVW